MSLHADRTTGALGIFAAAMIVLGSIHSANTSWNVNSRMALVFAIVERGTFAIDGYESSIFFTMDKAEFNEHYYSDKAFGVSLLCVPLYAAMQSVAHALGLEWGLQWKIYALRMWSASLPAAMSLSLLWLLMLRAGAPPRRALIAVTIAFFGSSWFGYSTLAMPYSPGIAACLGAFYLSLYPPGGELRLWQAATIGGLCGFALICDFLFGPIVLAVAIAFLLKLRAGSTRPTALLGASVLAGLVSLAAFFVYSYAIFGRLSMPYEFEVLPVFREGMARGVMGITAPRLGPAWFLTVHPYRGVFFWSPWITLALAGCVMGIREAGARRFWGWAGLLSFVCYLTLNSGYYMWWGGATMGARLMLPMMAALPMGLAEVCRRDRSSVWWWSLVGAGVLAMALSIPLALTNPQLLPVHSDQALMNATIGTPLGAPQFTYLARYYGGDWFFGPASRDHVLRVLPLIALTMAAAILVWTARRLPSHADTQGHR
ncbi:MAG: hypothetical protein ACRD2A_03875 [Vicinamibacterales bacterium]